jgi:photosystem II PsbU protein
MKRLIRWLSIFSLVFIGCLVFFGWTQPVVADSISIQPVAILAVETELPKVGNEQLCPEFGEKIDLNNANIIAFKDCQGFYPNLAKLIVTNGPYNKVEDVLEIPSLSDRQKQLLKSQLPNFKVSEPMVPLEMRMPPRPAMPAR